MSTTPRTHPVNEPTVEAGQSPRQVMVTRYGGPEVLAVAPLSPLPALGAQDVLIQVEASSLVFTDMLIRRNLYPMLRTTPPFVPGYDFVGRVLAVGPGVTAWQAGDRVSDLTQVGGNADRLIRRAETLVRVPDSVDALAAAAMPLSYLTAWQALNRLDALQTGKRLLVLGASGAVGVAALDIGRHLGLTIVGVASTRNGSLVSDYGARFLAYDDGNLQTRLQAICQADGPFDAVLDLAHGLAFRDLLGLIKDGGMLVQAGFAAGMPGQLTAGASRLAGMLRLGGVMLGFGWRKFLSRRVRMVFYDIAGRRQAQLAEYREDLATLFGLLADDKLHPVVAGVPLPEVISGHEQIERGGVQGRLVLDHRPR